MNKNCVQCHKDFNGQRKTTKFCSIKCSGLFRFNKPHSKKTPGYWLENGYRILQVDGKPIKEHRYVMEKHLQRKLSPEEFVHHKNHNPLDNRIENLEIMSRGEHSRLHRLEEVKNGQRWFGRHRTKRRSR